MRDFNFGFILFVFFLLCFLLIFFLLKTPKNTHAFCRLVCCSNHPDYSVELSCDNSMVSQTTNEESLMVPDFTEYIVPDRSGILMATAAAIAIGTIDGARYRVHNNNIPK
jgi:hypothetical protein